MKKSKHVVNKFFPGHQTVGHRGKSKKQTKQIRTVRIMNTDSVFDGCQMGGENGGKGEEVRGLRSTNK